MFGAVLSKAGGCAFICAGGHSFPAGDLLLDGVEHLPADDGFVVILGPVFGELSGVHDGFLADAVLAEGLLHHHVAAVFLILKDGLQGGDIPGNLAGNVGDLFRLQLCLDGPESVPGEIPPEDEADRFSLVRHDLRFPVLAADVAQEVLKLNDHPALLHGLLFAPDDVFADTLALGLGEGAVEGEQELALPGDGVEVLLLENDRDAQLAQFTGVFDGVQRVPGKAGEGFGEDEVDPAPPALADHPLEFLPAADGRAGFALVGEHVRHDPVRIFCDFFGVVALLRLVAGELLLVIGGDAAVGGDTELLFHGLSLGCVFHGRDHNESAGSGCHVWWPPSMVCPFFS